MKLLLESAPKSQTGNAGRKTPNECKVSHDFSTKKELAFIGA
jgi:hypothetical protein